MTESAHVQVIVTIIKPDGSAPVYAVLFNDEGKRISHGTADDDCKETQTHFALDSKHFLYVGFDRPVKWVKDGEGATTADELKIAQARISELEAQLAAKHSTTKRSNK